MFSKAVKAIDHFLTIFGRFDLIDRVAFYGLLTIRKLLKAKSHFNIVIIYVCE